MSTLTTPVFRMAWPCLFEMEKDMQSQEDKYYSMTMLFPKTTDILKLRKAAWMAAKEKWPKRFEGVQGGVWPAGIRPPFRDGDEKAHLDGYEGTFFARAITKFRMPIVDRNGIPVDDPNRVYGGVYARARVDAITYDTTTNKGGNFGLVAVQLIKDGERFGGGGPADISAESWGDIPEEYADDTPSENEGW